jgi:tetratricopeptide (TPR) repeat protein
VLAGGSATSWPFVRSATRSYDAALPGLLRTSDQLTYSVAMKPRGPAFILLALAVAVCLLSAPAVAQTQQDWALCQDLRSPELPIQGCTAVIEAGRQLLDRLAAAYNNRGVAYRLKTEFDKAIDDFDEAIKLRPNYPNAFNNRGVAYRNKGDLEHALADYDEAIQLKPDYLAALYNRGLALLEKGDYGRSVSDFSTVLEADPQNPLVLFRRGQALAKNGNIEASNADFATARTIKPDIADAVARMER